MRWLAGLFRGACFLQAAHCASLPCAEAPAPPLLQLTEIEGLLATLDKTKASRVWLGVRSRVAGACSLTGPVPALLSGAITPLGTPAPAQKHLDNDEFVKCMQKQKQVRGVAGKAAKVGLFQTTLTGGDPCVHNLVSPLQADSELMEMMESRILPALIDVRRCARAGLPCPQQPKCETGSPRAAHVWAHVTARPLLHWQELGAEAEELVDAAEQMEAIKIKVGPAMQHSAATGCRSQGLVFAREPSSQVHVAGNHRRLNEQLAPAVIF